jgi:hypothetical protein
MGGSNQTTQTTTIPQFQSTDWQNLINQSNAQTNADIGNVNYGQLSNQFQNSSQNILNNQVNPSQLASGITQAGTASQGWTNPGTAQQWESPYTNSALASTLQLGQQNILDPELAQTSQAAAASNALGGSREQVLQGMQSQQYNQNALNTTLQGENQAYNTGLGAFQSANQQNLAGQEAGAQTNLAGANSNIYANFAAGQNNLNSIAASEAPGQQLSSEAGILSGLPNQSTVTGVQTQSPGSWLGGILGGTLAGTGSLLGGLGSGGYLAKGGGITARPRKPRHRKSKPS